MTRGGARAWIIGLVLMITATAVACEGRDLADLVACEGVPTVADNPSNEIQLVDEGDPEPLHGGVVSGQARIELVAATAAGSVRSVRWVLDGDVIDIDRAAPFRVGETRFDSAPYDNCRHLLSAQITSADGDVRRVDAQFDIRNSIYFQLRYGQRGGSQAAPAGRNLLPVAAAEPSEAGWVGQGNADTGIGWVARSGDESLKVDVIDDPRSEGDTGTSRVSTKVGRAGVPTSAGTRYAGTVWIQPMHYGHEARCEIRYFNGDEIVTTQKGELEPILTATWTPLTCAGIAPRDADTMALRVHVGNVREADTYFVDSAHLATVSGSSGSAGDPGDPSPVTNDVPRPTTTTAPPTTQAPPPPPPTPTSPPRPSSGGFPNASNTGIRGVGLSPSDLTPSGGIEVRQNGAVIDMKDITGNIVVYADNVTIRRSRIRHSSGFGIRIMYEADGTVIEDTEIIGTSAAATHNIALTQFVCRRCDLSGAGDGAAAYYDVTIEDSYIHDLRKSQGSHNDGVQSAGSLGNGKPVIIRHNTIISAWQTSTSAIIASTEVGPIRGMIVENNYLSGGSYTIYLVEDRNNNYGKPTASAIRNNVFQSDSSGNYRVCRENGGSDSACNIRANFLYVDDTVSVTGNRFDSGPAL